jgi:hypothetical protein
MIIVIQNEAKNLRDKTQLMIILLQLFDRLLTTAV